MRAVRLSISQLIRTATIQAGSLIVLVIDMSLERHEKFCQEYVKCGDAETAAMLAGYSLTNLEGTADKLINLQGIRDRIKQLGGALPDLPPIAKMSMRERRDKVFEQWWRIAFFDPRRMYDKDG